MKKYIIATVFSFTLSLTASAADIKNGEAIFHKKCKACHRLSDGVKVGPGLAGVTKRRTDKWLDKWLTNPKGVIKSGDPVAVALKKKFKKTMRTLKIMQNAKNRKDIIAFLKQNDNSL